MIKAGYLPGDPAKVILVIVAVLIQGILPFLGHAAIVKTLRLLVLPFVVLFAVLLGFAIPHAHLHVVKHERRLAGLHRGARLHHRAERPGWTENGNDYTRYCPPNTSKKGIVGWVFLGTAVPEILIMTLGAVVGTFVLNIGTGAGGFLPFAHQSAIPSWFVVVFLLFAVVQIFGVNSLDMYSSGVTLQAIGRPGQALPGRAHRLRHRPRRHHVGDLQRVLHRYLSDFVDLVIIWIAPWCAIFLVDWALRRFRYVPSELQKTGRDSLYWRNGGIFWPAWVAQIVGMYAAISALYVNPTYYFRVPCWLERGHRPHAGRLPLRRGLQRLPGPGGGGARLLRAGPPGSAGAGRDSQEALLKEEGLAPA